MNISELLMTKANWDVKCIRPNATLAETAKELIDQRVGALLVASEANKMHGIVSERDLIPSIANFAKNANAFNAAVSGIMTRDVITCEPDDEVAFILRQMNEHAIRHMPVIEHGELVGVLSIRELTKAYEALQIEANTDPLTEVSCRRPFLRTVEAEFERAQRFAHPLSVAMLDIDHFKRVNDTYGHDAGDQALRSLAGLMISEFRTIDFVGRLGGEEFALVFPETELQGAAIACERLLANLRATEVRLDGATISLTASIGVSGMTEQTANGADLLKRADELLYYAKSGGRDCVVSDGGQGARTAGVEMG